MFFGAAWFCSGFCGGGFCCTERLVCEFALQLCAKKKQICISDFVTIIFYFFTGAGKQLSTYRSAGGALVGALALDLEVNVVGGLALDLEGAGSQVVELPGEQLDG